MIDFHSHILPGVDDGPETLDQSLSMLRAGFFFLLIYLLAVLGLCCCAGLSLLVASGSIL